MATLDLDDLNAIGEIVDLHTAPIRQRADEAHAAVFGGGGINESIATLKATQGRISFAALAAVGTSVGAIGAAIIAFFRQL